MEHRSHDTTAATYGMNAEIMAENQEVTFVLVGALLSPPLQLLAIVIQTLQAHDAVMHADPGRGQRYRGSAV